MDLARGQRFLLEGLVVEAVLLWLSLAVQTCPTFTIMSCLVERGSLRALLLFFEMLNANRMALF